MTPARVGKCELVQAVGERGAADLDAQLVGDGEVRQALAKVIVVNQVATRLKLRFLSLFVAEGLL